MLEFLIMLWMTIALIVEIPKLIQDLKRLIKGDIKEDDIDDYILK